MGKRPEAVVETMLTEHRGTSSVARLKFLQNLWIGFQARFWSAVFNRAWNVSYDGCIGSLGRCLAVFVDGGQQAWMSKGQRWCVLWFDGAVDVVMGVCQQRCLHKLAQTKFQSYQSGMGRMNKCRELTRPGAWRCCRSAVSASPLVNVDAPSTANLVSSVFYLVEVDFGRKKRWNIALAHCGGAPKFWGRVMVSTPVILNSSCKIPWLSIYYGTFFYKLVNKTHCVGAKSALRRQNVRWWL